MHHASYDNASYIICASIHYLANLKLVFHSAKASAGLTNGCRITPDAYVWQIK